MNVNINRYIFLLLFVLVGNLPAQATSVVYAGGPVYIHRDYAIDELKKSGFQRVIVWTIHVQADGSLDFNAEFPLVEGGRYIGASKYPQFSKDIASLKMGKTSIDRVEFGLSAAGSSTYDNVRNLVNCHEIDCGTGQNSILYKNFSALKREFPSIDALNNDDEHTYDLDSSVLFHTMLADIGFKTTIVPYANQSFWKSFTEQVNQARPGSVDGLYLQAYAGGSGNNPCKWQLDLPVYPGLWSTYNTPDEIENRMQQWRRECQNVVKGGFIWLYDEFSNSDKTSEYANAINNVFTAH